MLIRTILLLMAAYAAIILIVSINSDCDGADYIIVLGAPLLADMPTPDLAMRLDKACRYLKKNPETKLVLSGGKDSKSTVTQAYAMREYLEARNLKKKDIIMENYGMDTVDCLRNCFGLIDFRKKIVIVSSNYNIFRVKFACVMMGVEIQTLSSPAIPLSLVVNILKEEYLIIRTAIDLKRH